jgi:hypothetical protein
MSVAGRTPLRILTVAFAASSLLVVLQTVVFQLLAYDSPAIGKVSVALRVAFLLADGLALVGLLTLRPPARLGALLALGAVGSGVLGLAVSAMGSSARTLASLAAPLSQAEPMWSLGVALLAALGIASLVSPDRPQVRAHALRLVGVVGLLVGIAIAFRVGRLASPGQRSVGMAWTSWTFEVVRPALLAALAIVVARGRAADKAGAGPAESPYRAAGEGPPLATKDPVGPEAAGALRQAAGALRFYQIAFLLRLCVAVLTPVLAMLLSAMFRHDAMLPMAMLPLASLASGALVAVAHLRLLALPRSARARGLVVGAVVASALGLLVDVAAGLYGIYGRLAGGRYTGDQNLVFGISVGWPIVALLSGVALVLVASALGRVGETVSSELTTERARRTRALAIFTGAVQCGAALALIGSSAARHSGSTNEGGFVIVAMVVAGVGLAIALPIVHLLLVAHARAALLLRAG